MTDETNPMARWVEVYGVVNLPDGVRVPAAVAWWAMRAVPPAEARKFAAAILAAADEADRLNGAQG